MGVTMAILRGIFVLGVLVYLAGLGGTLTVLLVLAMLLGAVGHAGRTSPKKPAAIDARTVRGRPKLRLVK